MKTLAKRHEAAACGVVFPGKGVWMPLTSAAKHLEPPVAGSRVGARTVQAKAHRGKTETGVSMKPRRPKWKSIERKMSPNSQAE